MLGAQGLPGRVPHGLEDRLFVERAPDGLVQCGESPGLLVVAALGVEVPGALHREGDLVAQCLEKAELVVGERLSGTRRDVEHPSPLSLEPQGDAGVGRRGILALDDGGHARALRGVPCLHALPRPEDLGAEALAQALAANGLEVGVGHALRGGQAQSQIRLPSQEDPRRLQLPVPEDLLQGDVQDRVHVFFAVDARRDLGQDAKLPVALRQGRLEQPDLFLLRVAGARILEFGHGGTRIHPPCPPIRQVSRQRRKPPVRRSISLFRRVSRLPGAHFLRACSQPLRGGG